MCQRRLSHLPRSLLPPRGPTPAPQLRPCSVALEGLFVHPETLLDVFFSSF